MSDTPSKFTVVDRRKFTLEGELRNEQERNPEGESETSVPPAPTQQAEPQPTEPKQAKEEPAEAPPTPTAGPRLITMPSLSKQDEELGDLEEFEVEEEEEQAEGDEYSIPERPSDEASRQQKADYDKSSADLETMLRSANPGMPESHQIGFEHLVQQLYLSAMMQMGAGTPEGERPRIDILGARQTIDLMGVLLDKTKGNLSEREDRMLQSAIFELRMNFLELTNMISKSATQPPPGGKR